MRAWKLEKRKSTENILPLQHSWSLQGQGLKLASEHVMLAKKRIKLFMKLEVLKLLAYNCRRDLIIWKYNFGRILIIKGSVRSRMQRKLKETRINNVKGVYRSWRICKEMQGRCKKTNIIFGENRNATNTRAKTSKMQQFRNVRIPEKQKQTKIHKK